MNEPMRLFVRQGWYYINFGRGKSKALRTRNKAEAEAIFRETKKEWLRGRLFHFEDYKKVTIAELSADYCQRSGVSKWTLKKDELSFKLLSDVIGNAQIRTITKEKIRQFKKACLARGASPITVNGYLRHLKAAFHCAKEEGYLDKVPKFEMEKTPDALPRYILTEDITKLLNKAKEVDADLWRYIVFNLYTGCRRRESLGLEWQKVDFNKKICKVTGKGGRERVVPLLSPALEVLESIKKDVGKVFIQYHPDTLSKKFHALTILCGIDARLHDLRHSCATYLLKSGVDIRVVQKILGHTQISTTTIYAEVLDDLAKKEMKKLKFK